MNASQVIIGIIVIGLLAAGGWYFTTKGNDAMMEEEGAMMDEKDAMMEKEDGAMMENDGDSMMKDEDAMMDKDDAMMMEKGSYEPYAAAKLAKANDGDVVLFFRATWCPTCRALDADIHANEGSIPAGLTILDVNYDTETALKQKYGITYQHTLVQVSADGTQLKKWSGSPTLVALSAEVI